MKFRRVPVQMADEVPGEFRGRFLMRFRGSSGADG